MGSIVIRSKSSQRTIYSSSRNSHALAIADAICEGVSLSGADLSHLDLSRADLDGGDFRHADFGHSNLTGANMSECRLDGASFINTCLHGACMAFSSLKNCDFSGALFGGTDIAGAKIRVCRFDTHSALLLDFTASTIFDGNIFMATNDTGCAMTRPPVIVRGFPKTIAFFDHHLCIGSHAVPYESIRGDVAALPLHPKQMQHWGQRMMQARQDDQGA